MNKKLFFQCNKFVPGKLPRKAGEEFDLIAEWCKENKFERDFYGEGEFIESFEKKVADLLGFESGCFMPSGTMAQQIALKIYAEMSNQSGFAMHPTSHIELHEEHGYSHLCALSSVIIGDKNRQLNSSDIRDLVEPVSSVVIELPAREIGGQLPTWQELTKIKRIAKKKRVFLHMDGARLWEAKSFYKKSYKEISKGFDSVYVSFYKGIGNLTGAMLLGETAFIDQSRVWLRRFGGNLYQNHPFVASAAMRFDKAISQMPKYMKRTKEIYGLLKDIPEISFRPDPPQVNMFHLYINSTPEKLKMARDKIAKKDKLWLANDFKESEMKGWSFTELYIGEAIMEISNEEVARGFAKLCELSKK